MTRLMIKSFVLFVAFTFTTFNVGSQVNYNDFSAWYWFQMKYKVTKKTALNFQYQCRTNKNASQFDKSNFYFSIERKLTKTLQAELLTQLATDNRQNQFTIYGGLTHKFKFQHFSIFLRSAVQHKRNYFSGNPQLDNPFFEWRNRIRIAIPYGTHWSFALSTEPYLSFSNYESAYFSRIRNVVLASYQLNKFHSITTFYLVEPTLNQRYSRRNDFVLGLTYHVTLPKKAKEWKKFFDFKEKDEEHKPERKDSYN